ncbi:sigma-54-dependent transcriptional regulator [Bacteroidota bacterium]
MKEEASILVIDDDVDILTTARMFLKQFFSIVQVETNPDNIFKLMGEHDYDLILLDMNFRKGTNDGSEGFNFLSRILETDPNAVVIFITAYGGVDLAVKAIKNGAHDFIMKPWKNDKLLATIYSGLQYRNSKHELFKLKSQNEQFSDDIQGQFGEILGESLAMKKVFDIISKVASTEADVLILGENGTGKELVAREIHNQSKRADNIFVKVDLGAIHENLFESELFGHIKGAFTDAFKEKAGRFEIANGGTIFLDEIGNLSLPMQAKILSVLQNRKFCKVGSNKEIPVDIRLICATNMPLYEMVSNKEFREDLLYRINMVEVRVPPLRERSGDLQLLLNYFLEIYKAKYKKNKIRININTIKRLEKYSWPGNIRELQHAVERAVILNENEVLNFSDFSTDLSVEASEKKTDADLNLRDMEKRYILKSISRNNGNMTRAAKDLGLTRTALYRRLDKYGL